MPLYQYECTECDKQLSIFTPLVDRNNGFQCSCKGRFVRKFVPVGVHLKGEGWTRSPNDPTPKDMEKFKDRNNIED